MFALPLECESPPSAHCAIWGVGHRPWPLEGEDGADGVRERDISSVCNFIMGALDGAARQKAFPQDYFGLASLGASVLTTLTHYSGK